MYYTKEQIDKINSLRVAEPNRTYNENNGDVWIGTNSKRLELQISPFTYNNINTTIQGNSFNNGSQLVKLETNGKLPILDATNLINLTVQRNLIGIINGVNAIFTSPTIFVSNDVKIFVNGIKQTIITDYQLSSNNIITFTFSPNVGEILIIEY